MTAWFSFIGVALMLGAVLVVFGAVIIGGYFSLWAIWNSRFDRLDTNMDNMGLRIDNLEGLMRNFSLVLDDIKKALIHKST